MEEAKMSEIVKSSQAKKQVKILLISGIAAAVLYVCADIIFALSWQDYSYTAQTVSELIAINAPTRPYFAPILIVYALLVFAFGAGIWQVAGKKLLLRLTAAGLIGKEVLGAVVTIFFPMHLRGNVVTLTDTMHKNLTMAGVLFILLAIVSATIALGKRFRYYSILTMLIFVVCGVLAGSSVTKMEANLPTPWLGILERANIYGYLLWSVVLSTILLQKRIAKE